MNNKNDRPVKLRKTSAVAVSVLCVGFFLASCAQSSWDPPANGIPIQHNGRIKSFEAFSRETLRLLTGKEHWKHQSATKVILDAIADPGQSGQWKWIRIDNAQLKDTLGLGEERYFSYQDVAPHRLRIEALVRSSQKKRDADLRPSKLEQKAELLFTQLVAAGDLSTGKSITVIPTENIWLSPFISESESASNFREILALYASGQRDAFGASVEQWIEEAEEKSPAFHRRNIHMEIFYHRSRPFQSAWIFYLIAFVLLAFFRKTKVCFVLGGLVLFLGIFSHTAGLVLRSLILWRPPVSNMYESMIFMNWVLMLAAVIFAAIKKTSYPLAAGALVSTAVMIYGNLLPISPSLDVLVPVLRSNYWLSIHVMTIVSSYGIFGLAMGLGHRHLLLDVSGRLPPEAQNASANLIYRVIQLGVILLGTGTVLGGVWANESWGRFWGWDPKETWALITFLGYLILVHLKHLKKLGDFGLALLSVLCFLLVLMTWYGVNFVLGRGLHSYGAGSGGLNWVVFFLVLEALFLAGVALKKMRAVR